MATKKVILVNLKESPLHQAAAEAAAKEKMASTKR